MLDLTHVRAFLAVVEHGGFSRAAAALETTQPVVSQQVRKLETAVGARLLARSRARTVPTEDGERFLPHARALLRAEQRARDSIDGAALTVAASTNIGAYLLPPLIEAYARRTAGPPPEMLLGTNPETVDRLESGTADLALMEWWDDRPGFAARHWRTEPLIVIVNPAHRWALRKQVEKAELFDAPLIGGEPGTGTGQRLRQVFGPAVSRLRTTLTVGSTAAVKEAVKAGLGISIVMAASAAEELRHGSLHGLRISDAAITKDLYAILPVDLPETAPAVRFDRFLAKAAPSAV